MSQSDFVSRGQALVVAGQFQEAVKVCRLGLLGRPTTVEGRVVLGQALLALKRYDEVLAEMRVALELDHTSVPAQVLRGEALLRKGDANAAIETLHKARQAAPGDAKILQLLSQAEAAAMQPAASTSHPAVNYVGGPSPGETKNYPSHNQVEGDEDSGGGYTRPTSLAAPGSLRRSSQRRAAVEPAGMPSPEALAVGDKSGTVEVDPELDGIEMPGDRDDLDPVAPPPAGKPGKIGGQRGSVRASREPEREVTVQGSRKAVAAAMASAKPVKIDKPAKLKKPKKQSTPTMDLDDDDLEVADTMLPQRRKLPAPKSAVRDSIAMPAGPIDLPHDEPPPSRGKPKTAPPPIAPTPMSSTAQALPPPPAVVPRIGAAMPTVAAIQPPAPLSPASMAAAARQTVAIVPSVPLPPPGGQQLFSPGGEQVPMWAAAAPDPRATAAAHEPTALAPGIDPRIAALSAPPVAPAMPAIVEMPVHPAMPVELPSVPTPTPLRTRKARSKLAVFTWIMIGLVVIGGGVFAGFQIRALRLQKQIAQARDRATGLAKADTYTGWTAATASLADIAHASNTVENRAAVARARALVAFEFVDGVAEAKAATDELAGQASLDADIAATYIALAQSDAKAAKLAGDAALSAASQDAAAQYVAGQAALRGGDAKAAVTYLKEAFAHDPRPLYGVALARAYRAGSAWDDAAAVLDKVLAASADHPAALIERALVFAQGGRIAPGVSLGMDVHTQLEKLVAEGAKPPDQQPRGVAPAQVAFAELALAQVDFARGDQTTARGDLKAAAAVGLDDQRFGEEAVDTLYAIGDLPTARSAAEHALQTWPTSRRLRVALAEVLLATGHPNEALDALAKPPELMVLPLALAVRGQVRAALGDTDEARADFDAALKKLPGLEPALVGRAALDLAAGDVDEAKKLVEPHVGAGGAPPALATIYAAILRRTGDPAAVDKAKAMLDKVVAGPPGPEVAHAQLELARLERDVGHYPAARLAYADAAKTGNFDARLEQALLIIEDKEPDVGRGMLEQMLKDAGDHPPAPLVIETARARMLAGDHAGAQQLLDGAEKAGVTKWRLERERGRLALRRGDYAGAANQLVHALDTCGADPETFLLAADTATSDDKQTAGLADKVKKLAPERLKDQPEAAIVAGKLLIAAGKWDDALKQLRPALAAMKDHASDRRLAQVHLGIAVAQYNLRYDVEASNELELVHALDPSLYFAYLFHASLLADTKKKQALDLAKKAVRYDPDSVDGWILVGQLAQKLGDRKLLADAVTRLSAIAPTNDELKKLKR